MSQAAESVEDVFADVLGDEEQNKDVDQHEDSKQDDSSKPAGYMNKEDWIASGKDPELWVSEEVFKAETKRIKETSRLKRELAETRKDFDNRLKNVHLVSQAQIAKAIRDANSRRDDAIDTADKKAVKELDKEIDELNKQADLIKEAPAQESNLPPEVVEWESENQWIYDLNDPRTAPAKEAFKEANEKGKTIAGCLIAAENAARLVRSEGKHQDEVKKKPPVSMADSSKSASVSRNDSATLSWNQLSNEEAAIFEEFFEHTGMKKADYLKTVADQRRGASK